jgi:hypothetical protein
MRKFTSFFCSLFVVAMLAGACTTHRTVTDEVAYDQRTGQPVSVKRETTTTHEDTTQDTGVLSGTVNVIGEVIALPFRAVGGLVRAIF